MRDSTAYQTAAHAAALQAAKDLVARLEAAGPDKGWNQDNQSLAICLAELEGDEEKADQIADRLNRLAYGG